jgi:hypothetical protein
MGISKLVGTRGGVQIYDPLLNISQLFDTTTGLQPLTQIEDSQYLIGSRELCKPY